MKKIVARLKVEFDVNKEKNTENLSMFEITKREFADIKNVLDNDVADIDYLSGYTNEIRFTVTHRFENDLPNDEMKFILLDNIKEQFKVKSKLVVVNIYMMNYCIYDENDNLISAMNSIYGNGNKLIKEIISSDAEVIVPDPLEKIVNNLKEMEKIIENVNDDKPIDSLDYSDENFENVLHSLSFTKQKNPNGYNCYDVYDDNGIPKWQYETIKKKKNLYYFFVGMLTERLNHKHT